MCFQFIHHNIIISITYSPDGFIITRSKHIIYFIIANETHYFISNNVFIRGIRYLLYLYFSTIVTR
jgi:hypothetical protein